VLQILRVVSYVELLAEGGVEFYVQNEMWCEGRENLLVNLLLIKKLFRIR
jgi:hypothetical protein